MTSKSVLKILAGTFGSSSVDAAVSHTDFLKEKKQRESRLESLMPRPAVSRLGGQIILTLNKHHHFQYADLGGRGKRIIASLRPA